MARPVGRPSRKEESRAVQYDYKPPSSLDIPEEVAEIFDKLGFHLRWVRFMINGQEDVQNVTKRLREGYTFINKIDIPDHVKDWFESNKIRTYNQAICVGDLALAKIEKYKAQARRDYTQGLSERQVKAARREADQVSDNRMKTMTPLFDDSETEVEIST